MEKMGKFGFIGWVRGQRLSRKIPTSIVTDAEDPSSGVLQALTIDLIHDWCQRGTMSRLVLEAQSMARADCGKSLEREKTAVAGAYCNDLRLHFKRRPRRTIAPPASVSARCYTCFHRHSVMSRNQSRLQMHPPQHPHSFCPLSKKQQHKKRKMRSILRKAINTF